MYVALSSSTYIVEGATRLYDDGRNLQLMRLFSRHHLPPLRRCCHDTRPKILEISFRLLKLADPLQGSGALRDQNYFLSPESSRVIALTFFGVVVSSTFLRIVLNDIFELLTICC